MGLSPEAQAALARRGAGGLTAATPPSRVSLAEITAQLTAEPDPNPLDKVEYTGDIEEDSRRELGEIGQAFKERERREQERFANAVDTEFWIAACFISRDDKEAFLRALDVMVLGDKYLDGYDLAEQLLALLQADEDTRTKVVDALAALLVGTTEPDDSSP